MTDNARQTIPCPYLDEDGRPCQGRIVCVHSPSGSMLWSLREDGQVELLIGLPAEEARYRLICSCGHGRRKAQPHFVELPEQLQHALFKAWVDKDMGHRLKAPRSASRPAPQRRGRSRASKSPPSDLV